MRDNSCIDDTFSPGWGYSIKQTLSWQVHQKNKGRRRGLVVEEVEMSILIYIVVALVLVTFVAVSLTGLEDRH